MRSGVPAEVGRTPWSGLFRANAADFVGEKRVQGDPRGPGGPPHQSVNSMDLFDELREKFPGLMSPKAPRQAAHDQLTVALTGPDVRPLAEHLRSAYESRLVAVFAEDRVAAEGVFYNYYVFEQPGERCYLIFQAPIAAGRPSFPSLAAELPAVNWQEREIQDWFGLEATGHPNPRRVALHDNWPDVHPLRKDFSAATGPAALRRRAPRLSPHPGRGSFPDPRRPRACGHHRARPLQFRGRRRADSVPPTAHVLHPQGHRKAVRRHAHSPRRVPRGEHLGRFRLLARHRVLPGHRERVRYRSSPARPASCAPSCWNWSASATTSATSAPSLPTSVSWWPTRMPAGCGKWSCA